MTTALYRRYRPDTFQDVIGQDHVTAPLMAALRGDRVTHAYLFSGPRGCGKTTSARILARCLNCERFPTDTPCGQCPSCRDLATGGPGSLDVVEIDAASHNGVDDARDLRERASFAPARDRFKIFILDEAHMVTPQGFNALLKLVEEPPAHVKFVFATTEPEKVIGTIRSRTHHYPFRLVAPDTLEGYLAHLCDAEDVRVGPGVFPLVTRAGGGSVRDTLSVMDQLIGGAIDGEVNYARAVALLGYTDTTMLDACVDALAASDGAGVFRVVDRVVSSGHDPRRFVEDLLQRLRDLLVIALAGSEAGPALGSLPDDELARMEVQSRTIGAAGLSRAADTAAQALSQMVGATSPRLQLELLMARLLVPGRRAVAPGGQTAGGQAPGGQAAPVQRPGSGAGAGGAETIRADGAGGGGPAMASDTVRRAAPAPLGGAPARGAPPAAGPPAGPATPPPAAAGPAAPASAASGAPAAPSAPAPSPTPQGGVAPVDWDAPAQAPGQPPQRPAQAGPPGGQAGPPEGAASQRPGRGDSAADAEMIRGRWEEVLEAAKRSRRATWALVGPNSQPGGIRDGVFEVIFSGQGLVNAFENGGHGPVLSAALHQALGLRLEVHAVLAGPGGRPGPGPGGPGGGRPAGPAGPGGGPGPAAPDGGAGGPGWPDDAGTGGAPSGLGGMPGASAPRGPVDMGGPADGGGPGSAALSPEASASSAPASPRPPASAAPPEAEDDGWGVIAVPGARRAARESAEPVAPAAGPAADVADRRPSPEPGRPTPAAPSSPAAPADPGGARARSAPVPSSPEAAPGASPDATGSGGAAPAGPPRTGPAGGGRVVLPPGAGPAPATGPVSASGPAWRASAGSGGTSPVSPGSAPPAPGGSGAVGSAPAAPSAAPPSAASPAGRPVSPAAPPAPPEPAPSPGAAAPAASAVSAAPPPDAAPPDPADAIPLATVHRLHALPKLPGGAAPSSSSAPTTRAEQHRQPHEGGEHHEHQGLAPVSWDGPATFSDGTPVPQEPPPEEDEGPEDSWAPADAAGDRVSAARAAARAAARGQAQPGAARGAVFSPSSVEDDVPSEDDEDAEEAGVVGLEVVKRLLGATVLEEITVTQEGR